jgi:hypothetical protein
LPGRQRRHGLLQAGITSSCFLATVRAEELPAASLPQHVEGENRRNLMQDPQSAQLSASSIQGAPGRNQFNRVLSVTVGCPSVLGPKADVRHHFVASGAGCLTAPHEIISNARAPPGR